MWALGTLVEDVDPLEDPRHGNAGRHSLHDIMVIAFCTILCGGETCTDMALFGQSKREFLKSFLPLRKVWNSQPRHLLQGVPPFGYGGLPDVVPEPHGPVYPRL